MNFSTNRRDHTEEEIMEVLKLVIDKVPTKDILKKAGISLQTLINWCQKTGLKPQRQRATPKDWGNMSIRLQEYIDSLNKSH